MRNSLEKTVYFALQNIPTLVFFLIPLFFLTNTVDYFAFNKFYLLNAIGSASLILWCLQNILSNKINITLSPSLKIIFVLVLAHIASAFFISPTKILSLTGLTTLFTSLFFITLAYTSTKPSLRQVKRHLFTLLLSLLIISLITILHFFGLTKYLFGAEITQGNFFNLTGGVIPALSLTIPLLLGTIYYTFLESNSKTKIFLFFISVFAISAAIIDISLLLPKNNVSPITLLPLKASWSIALDIFKNPKTAFLGTGPENYFSTFTQLRPAYLNNTKIWNIRFSESGSFLLTILTTSGLIGGLSFLVLFTKNISKAIKSFKNSESKPILGFIIVSLIGFLISFVITPTGITSIVIATTLLGTLTQIYKKNDDSQIKDLHFNISSEGQQNKVLTHFLPIVSLIISTIAVYTYWSFGLPFYRASQSLYQASQKINTDITGSFLKQVEAQKLNPYYSTYPMVLSQTYQQVATYYLQKQDPTEEDKKNTIQTMQRAIDSGRIAAKIDPVNVLVWENLSGIYQAFIGVAEGAPDLAISHLAQAISLDPTNPKLRLQLGILYYNLQDKDQAIKLINQSLDLKSNWEIPYLNLYQIYLQNQDYAKAQANLKQALTLISPQTPNYDKLQKELTDLTENLKSVVTPTPTPTPTK